MTDYEWEPGRLPRTPTPKSLGGSRYRRGPIADYLALEFPRESVAWVMNVLPVGKRVQLKRERSKASKGRKRRSD